MSEVPTPKQECEALMNDPLMLPFAERCLASWGVFHPFAAGLSTDGSVVGFGVEDSEGSAPEKIEWLRRGLVEKVAKGALKATALAYDVRMSDPETREKRDAIAIELDHELKYSVVVYFRYRLENGRPILEAPTASRGEGKIFG